MSFPATAREMIEEGRAEAKRTGKRVRRLLSREDIIKEFPNFAKDPRSAFTPERFLLDITPMEGILVEHLLELCLGCGSHPLAVQKALSVQGLAPTQVVYILRQDLDELKQVSGKGATTSAPAPPAPKPRPTSQSKEEKPKTK